MASEAVSGQSRPATLLDSKMIERIRRHTRNWTEAQLAQCSITHNYDTKYTDCKAELEVTDANGKVILLGRQFRSGPPFSFWEPRT